MLNTVMNQRLDNSSQQYELFEEVFNRCVGEKLGTTESG